MIRVIEYPEYMTQILRDEEGAPLVDEDEIIQTEQVLMFTIVETYEVTERTTEDETEGGGVVETLLLIEKKRVMANGNVYLINGNVEQFIPVAPEAIQYTDSQKLWDAIEYLINN